MKYFSLLSVPFTVDTEVAFHMWGCDHFLLMVGFFFQTLSFFSVTNVLIYDIIHNLTHWHISSYFSLYEKFQGRLAHPEMHFPTGDINKANTAHSDPHVTRQTSHQSLLNIEDDRQVCGKMVSSCDGALGRLAAAQRNTDTCSLEQKPSHRRHSCLNKQLLRDIEH